MSSRPIQFDLKLVSFRNDQVAVEAKDHTLLFDINPSDQQNKVDYYVPSRLTLATAAPSEAVILPNAPMPLAATLAGGFAKKIRYATEYESTQAQMFFLRAKVYAEHQMDGFLQAVQLDQTKRKKEKEIYIREVDGEAALAFKGADGTEQYAVPFYQKYFEKGKTHVSLIEVRIKIGDFTIVESTKEFLKTMQALLGEWGQRIVKLNDQIMKARYSHSPDKAACSKKPKKHHVQK